MVEEKLIAARKRLAVLSADRSPSAAESQHDAIRENLEREIIAQENVVRGLEQFKGFLVASGEKSQIEEGAELSVLLTGSNEKVISAIYAPISVALEETTIITPKSPFGQALLNKRENESFSYTVGGNQISGRVQEIS